MSILTALISSKLAIGISVASLAVAGGAGVAAYADALPPAAQQVAHQLVGAPAPATSTVEATADTGTTTDSTDPTSTPDPTTTPDPTATGDPTATPDPTATGDPTSTPDPTTTDTPEPTPTDTPTASTGPIGPDATGPAAHGLCTAFVHGGLGTFSTARASLAAAAGGAANISTYCAPFVKTHAEQAVTSHDGVTATHRSHSHATSKTETDSQDSEDSADSEDSTDSSSVTGHGSDGESQDGSATSSHGDD